MPRPGVDVQIVDSGPSAGANLDTGQAFFIGFAERGPIDAVSLIQSHKEYERLYGGRADGGSVLSDSVGAYFSEGGGALRVIRLGGEDAAAASGVFGSMDADALSPGTWGNDVTLKMVAGGGASHVVTVEYQGEEVERSGPVVTADDVVAFSQASRYVRILKGADNLIPADATSVDLAGGATDNTYTADSLKAALDRFEYAQGPGQVAAPGLTAAEVHAALLSHAQSFQRVALCDALDGLSGTALEAAAIGLYNIPGVRFACLLGTWHVYPAEVSPATIAIPMSGVFAGEIARSDALGNPNVAAAGANGISRLAVGLTTAYTDDEREAVNAAGVIMAKEVQGTIRTYGGRTAAGPDDKKYEWFSNSRVLTAIAHNADAIGENYVLRQIDGRGQIFAALESELRGMLLGYFNAGALFGETPDDAFSVNTSSAVNTIETIANGEIHAVIKVKCSPSAEWLYIEIVKVPVERAITA